MADTLFDRKLSSPRDIPQVEQVVADPFVSEYVKRYSRSYVLQIVRAVFDRFRDKLKEGKPVDGAEIKQAILDDLESERHKFFTSVVNCTGIVVHTNLGRSPLGKQRAQTLLDKLTGYSNLEFDVLSGKRGKRGSHVTRLFSLLTGAGASCVVNNNAAAVYLILNTFCKGKECVVSRGELVQIGGGFRMPDVMTASGAILKEIGTTNRVAFDNYYRAASENTGLIVKIHLSNFKLTGFTESVDAKQLAALGRERNIPVMYDLGSGSWLRPSDYGIKNEPSITNALDSGVDLVCFSGDKLFGGPQAGIILGNADLIERLHKNPLYRAFRPDKVTLLLLEETLLSYLHGTETSDSPAITLLTTDAAKLKTRAERICGSLRKAGVDADVLETTALAGGGSAPEEEMQSYGVRLNSKMKPDDLACSFRSADPPIIGRIIDDKFVLDLKALLESEDGELTVAIKITLGT